MGELLGAPAVWGPEQLKGPQESGPKHSGKNRIYKKIKNILKINLKYVADHVS